MRRRQFITLLGGAAAGWPLAVRAQRRDPPIVGVLSIQGLDATLAMLRKGLGDGGLVEGRDYVIEARLASEPDIGHLRSLAAELVRRRVGVIVAIGTAGVAQAAKAETSTIPIVFSNGSDPVKVGLVASMNRPGGNATGVSFQVSALGPKRLELLREMVPQARSIAFLVNPINPVTEGDIEEMQRAAGSLGQSIVVVRATNDNEINAAFAAIAREGADALFVNTDAYLSSRGDQIVGLAARYRIPASYPNSAYVRVGGLTSYGDDRAEMQRQVGVYAARILKGDKPADLPVVQPTKFEFVINLKTAKALGLTMPPTMLTLADEVIE
jgi:putative ABC transport system substrate-binding protein